MENNGTDNQQSPPLLDANPIQATGVQVPIQPVGIEPETESSKPKPKHRILKIFLGVIVVLLLIGVFAGWFILHEVNKQLAPTGRKITVSDLESLAQVVKNKKSLPGTVITSPNPAAWKTYENAGYNFSFQFPAKLTLSDQPKGFGVTNIILSNTQMGAGSGPVYQIVVMPTELAKVAGVDFNADYAMPDNATSTLSDGQGNSQTFTKLRNRTVDSLEAFDFMNSQQTGNTDPQIGTAIAFGDSIIMISTVESKKPQLMKMLASFKYPL